MRTTGAVLLALMAGPLLADEVRLKDGRRVQVEAPLRVDGTVVDGPTQGQAFKVAEDQVLSPNLWSLPTQLRLKDGRSLVVTGITRVDGRVRFQVVAGGAKRQVPEAQVAWPSLEGMPVAAPPPVAPSPAPAAPAPSEEAPSLPPFPLTLKLTDGREIRVDELVRKDDKVRFREVTTRARRQVDADRVISPSLASIPWLLRLTDGREIQMVGAFRQDGKVRFKVARTGERRQVAEGQVVSPPLASLPTVGAPVPPTVTPTAPPPPVTPTVPAVPPPPPTGPAIADFEVMPDRWTILDELMRPLSEQDLEAWRVVRGRSADPYNQNTLKGDRPVIGNSIFLVFTATLDALSESRRVPLPSGVSAERPVSLEFFGNGNQLFTTPRALVSFELFKGQTAFRPKTWALKVTGAYNENYLRTKERNAVHIDPREGVTRSRRDFSLEEAFGELKLADLSPHYDVVSVRAGIHPFVSDFRGFIFSDSNLGARLFGNLSSNRWQYNLAYFDLLEKETNSELNTFDPREQKVFIANVFRQDFLTTGYTLSLSYHRSQDEASLEPHFDANDFPVRPARIGSPRLHDVTSNYVGWTGDGHIGRLNVSHAAYFAFGDDEDHPLGDREGGSGAQDIGAGMAALEASIDKDWARFKTSVFFATGDDDIEDGKARGFDTIYDSTSFAGGPFSFWSRSGIPLTQTAVLLKTPGSLLPSLRSNKFEGQANFVNPGLLLLNAALDLDLTPKLKAVLNANYLRFHKTGALQALLFQPDIRKDIGIDLGAGALYRPFLNENVVIQAGLTALLPGAAFEDLFSSACSQPSCGASTPKLYNGFLLLKLSY